MPTDLGDVIPLSVTITDATGQPANAGNVALTITLPDATVISSASISPTTTTGVYQYDYTTTQVGNHVVGWLATGINSSAFTDSFYVSPADNGDFISLTQFKNFIKKTITTDDETLRTFISGSCGAIADRVGQIAGITVVEDRVSLRSTINLEKYPIIEIVSIEQLPGLASIPEGNKATGALGWILLDASIGHLDLGRCGSGEVRITYRAGMTTIPPNYILAALEMTAQVWRISQQNAGGGRPPIGLDETVVPGVSFALPYNVRQLLGLDKLPRKQIYV